MNSSCTSGSRRTARRSACSLSTIARGVLPGATSIHHDAASYPGTPISASGGTSGMAPTRSFVVTPSIRTLPLCASGAGVNIVHGHLQKSPIYLDFLAFRSMFVYTRPPPDIGRELDTEHSHGTHHPRHSTRNQSRTRALTGVREAVLQELGAGTASWL